MLTFGLYTLEGIFAMYSTNTTIRIDQPAGLVCYPDTLSRSSQTLRRAFSRTPRRSPFTGCAALALQDMR